MSAANKRKKPTKAQVKQKREKRQAMAQQPAQPSVVIKDAPGQGAAPGSKKVLHVGCGVKHPAKLHKTFHTPEWQEIRLDIDKDVQPDILGDITDMNTVKDGTMDAVWSSHNVEHLYPHQVPVALKEFYRVLRDGGFMLVTLPDVQAVASHVARGNLEEPLYESPAGPISAIDILYGFRKAMAKGNLFMAHRTGFTAETLGLKMRDAGFCNIQVKRDSLDLWAIGYKWPYGHPNRQEKVTVIDGNQGKDQQNLPQPVHVPRMPHPGAGDKPGMRTDEIDQPPKRWEKPAFLK